MIEKTIPAGLQRDPELRELLLSFYLETLTSAELADWLKCINQDSRGTIEERKSRIRANTNDAGERISGADRTLSRTV